MSWLRSRWFRAIQMVALAAILLFLGLSVAKEWGRVRGSGVALAFRPGWILLSLGIVWVMWVGLIEGWRRIAVSWGARLHWPLAGRIWMLASFYKYIPGKVAAIAGMFAISERAGINGKFTLGSAVVMQVLNIGTGVAVAALMLGPTVKELRPNAGVAMMLLGLLMLGTMVAVRSRWLSSKLWRAARVADPTPEPPHLGLLAFGVGINVLTWLAYGLALVWLAHGILPGQVLEWKFATGAFAAAYVTGYLGPAPGGVGMRDGALVILLSENGMPIGPALALAGASRLMFTLNELGAAAPFFFTRESDRDRT